LQMMTGAGHHARPQHPHHLVDACAGLLAELFLSIGLPAALRVASAISLKCPERHGAASCSDGADHRNAGQRLRFARAASNAAGVGFVDVVEAS